MALKALKLRKSIDLKKKELDALREKDADFVTREAELEAAINEAETDEDMAAVDEEMQTFTEEKEAHEATKADLEREVGELETELAAEERKQETDPVKPEEREAKPMATAEKRTRFGLSEEFVRRESVQDFLVRVREHIGQKRALTNIGLTIPQDFLGILRENLINYSKLYRHVNTGCEYYRKRISAENGGDLFLYLERRDQPAGKCRLSRFTHTAEIEGRADTAA